MASTMKTKRKGSGKTKPGKRVKPTINQELLNPEVKTSLKAALLEGTESFNNKQARVIKSPFTACVLKKLFDNEGFLTELKSELNELEFYEKNNDLYKFRQSKELANSSGPCVSEFRRLMVEEMRPWITEMTGIPLTDAVNIFCAQYDHTDTLLCHDDELEGRRVAFIYYLVPDWSLEDGGSLDLFDTDILGYPRNVIERLVPQHNYFSFFEVSPVSFHQVAEVLAENKTRLSLTGWFHGPGVPRPLKPPPEPEVTEPYKEIEESEFFSWINPTYTDPNTQGDIQVQFEESSEINLTQFLNPEKYQLVADAVRGAGLKWIQMGPPDRKHFYRLKGDLPEIVEKCHQFFQSDPFALLLSNLTGLKLHPLAEEDEDESEEEGTSEEKVYNPRCRGGFGKWTQGCYTLVRDDDSEQSEFALEARLFLNCEGWVAGMGGQSVYIARGEDEELITVEPETNSLSLVYKDKETLGFVKYVNSSLSKENGGCGEFHDIQMTYYE